MKPDDITQIMFASGIIIIGAVSAYVGKWEIVTGCMGIMGAILKGHGGNIK